MAYTQYDWSTLRHEIRTLIGDLAGVYWTDLEIRYAIWEALREWSVLTRYWREQQVVGFVAPYSTAYPKRFYDLSVECPTLRPRTVTIDSLVREMQYHLYEPANGLTGVGMTQQFTVTQLVDAILRARNQLVLDCQLPLALYTLPVVAGDGLVDLDNSTLSILRVAWTTPDLRRYRALFKTDEFLGSAFGIRTGTPQGYSQSATLPAQLRLLPAPDANGILELLSANTLGLLSGAVNSGTTLGLPDDFTPAVKFGALADILNMDGESEDVFRSQYFAQRYDAYVMALQNSSSIISADIQGKTLQPGTIYSMDTTRPDWGVQYAPKPTTIACAFDLFTVSPLPKTAYSGVLTMVRSAPLPVLDTDIIDIGSEEIGNLLDFCQHYLSIKMGGRELQQTFKQYNGFWAHAGKRNTMLVQRIPNITSMFDQSQKNTGYLGLTPPTAGSFAPLEDK